MLWMLNVLQTYPAVVSYMLKQDQRSWQVTIGVCKCAPSKIAINTFVLMPCGPQAESYLFAHSGMPILFYCSKCIAKNFGVHISQDVTTVFMQGLLHARSTAGRVDGAEELCWHRSSQTSTKQDIASLTEVSSKSQARSKQVSRKIPASSKRVPSKV